MEQTTAAVNMMPRWMRALLVAAAATAAAALALNVMPGWKESAVRHHALGSARARSREDVIDDLSDEEKERMLRELGQHV